MILLRNSNVFVYLRFLIVLTCVVSPVLTSCASYRAVRVVKLTDRDSGNSENFYGIAKNNVLVPEFTLDERNHYPTSVDEAWQRFETRKTVVDSQVNRRYRIPNSFLFQSERLIVGAGLILVAPIAIPIQYLGGLNRGEQGRRSWSRTAYDYFDLSLNDVIEDESVVRDRLALITL